MHSAVASESDDDNDDDASSDFELTIIVHCQKYILLYLILSFVNVLFSHVKLEHESIKTSNTWHQNFVHIRFVFNFTLILSNTLLSDRRRNAKIEQSDSTLNRKGNPD